MSCSGEGTRPHPYWPYWHEPWPLKVVSKVVPFCVSYLNHTSHLETPPNRQEHLWATSDCWWLPWRAECHGPERLVFRRQPKEPLSHFQSRFPFPGLVAMQVITLWQRLWIRLTGWSVTTTALHQFAIALAQWCTVMHSDARWCTVRSARRWFWDLLAAAIPIAFAWSSRTSNPWGLGEQLPPELSCVNITQYVSVCLCMYVTNCHYKSIHINPHFQWKKRSVDPVGPGRRLISLIRTCHPQERRDGGTMWVNVMPAWAPEIKAAW